MIGDQNLPEKAPQRDQCFFDRVIPYNTNCSQYVLHLFFRQHRGKANPLPEGTAAAEMSSVAETFPDVNLASNGLRPRQWILTPRSYCDNAAALPVSLTGNDLPKFDVPFVAFTVVR